MFQKEIARRLIMKLQIMNNTQYFICLPKEVVMRKGWIKGDDIKVILTKEGEVILK